MINDLEYQSFEQESDFGEFEVDSGEFESDFGEFETDINGTTVKQRPKECTTLVHPDGSQFLTFVLSKPSIASAQPYTLMVPGVESAKPIEIRVP